MKISIIISTYSTDRYDDLVDLLGSIKIQTYKDIEIIIVIDEDKELYSKIESLVCVNHDNIKTIFNPKNNGLSYSRNLGIASAIGDIVSFTDDDAMLDPRWAESIINMFNDEDVGAATGDVVPLWENEDMSWFPRELYWMISCSYIMTPNKKCEIERGFGTNMSFKRGIIDKIDMFNTDLGIKGKNWIGGEDTDMFLRVRDTGKKVMFDPDAKVIHKVYTNRINTRNIIKRAFNGGISLAAMKKVRKYDIYGSTENSYLSVLIFEFYPKGFKKLVLKPIESIKQMIAVTLVIAAESIGYLSEMYLHQKEEDENIKKQ